jgi:hypothetical protein
MSCSSCLLDVWGNSILAELTLYLGSSANDGGGIIVDDAMLYLWSLYLRSSANDGGGNMVEDAVLNLWSASADWGRSIEAVAACL